jgi:DNA-directed RNA polymerase specialized sigma24 family protein
MEEEKDIIFYTDLKEAGDIIRDFFSWVEDLQPRERQIFMEYHFFKTHMRKISESHQLSLGRTYEILYRAEEKVAMSKPKLEKK